MHITDKNLMKYLSDNYGEGFLVSEAHIAKVVPLLQKNYGGQNDCTLTSITSIISYIVNNKVWITTLYQEVEDIAEKYFYKEDRGTMYAAIRSIFNESVKKYSNKTSCAKFGKGTGYNFEYIKSKIDEKMPLILSMTNDGMDYYKNHSVTIVGYAIYKINGKNVNLLKIYDNWTTEVSYVDYNKLSPISSIHCLRNKEHKFLDFIWFIILKLFGGK